MNDALEVVQALMCCACNNPDHHDAAAVLAAASGPWAEQLDGAKARTRALEREVDERDKAHEAIVAILGKEAKADIKSARTKVELMAQRLDDMTLSRDKHRNRAIALRAELDNLRETLAQKIEAAVLPIDHTKIVTVIDVQRECAAIVRGSDDE